MKRRSILVRKLNRDDDDSDASIVPGTPAERIHMMWQLTVDAWSFREDFDATDRLKRHVVRVVRKE